MTSKELTNKKSGINPPLHNAKYNTKLALKISIIIFVLHLVAMPIVFINAIYNITSGISTSPSDWTYVTAIIATGIAGASGIIIAAMNFRYLYNRPQVDMCLSSPLTRKQRFLSDYLSGLASYIAPFIVSQIFVVLILICGIIFVDGKTYIIHNYYEIGKDYSYNCTFFADGFPYYAKLLLIGILTMIILYTAAVFIFVCCGTLFESVFYTIVLNAAVPLSIYLVYSGFFTNLYGINVDMEFKYVFSSTSAVGGIFAAACMLNDDISVIKWAIAFVIVTAAIFVGAYFLFMKRKAEQTGKPFAFIGLYYFAATLVMICITSVFVLSDSISNVIIPLILTTVIIYLLLEIIVNRGFKKLWKGILRYTVTVGVYIALLVAVDKTYLFGIELKVPDAKNVKSIEISYSGIYRQLPTSYSSSIKNANKNERNYFYTLKSEDNINAVIAAHQLAVDDYKANKDSYDSYGYIGESRYTPSSKSSTYTDIVICYNMKNGTKTERNYILTVDAVNAIKSIDVSEELKAQAADYLRDYYACCYSDFMDYSREYDEKMTLKIVTAVDSFTDYINKGYFDIDREFYERYGEALAEDTLALTADTFFEPTESMRVTTFSTQTYVTNAYTNTRRLLAEYGYIPNVTEEDARSVLFSKAADTNDNYKVMILSPDDYKNFFGTDAIYTEQNIDDAGKYVLAYSDELAKLAEKMQLVYITEKPCYTIIVNGSAYVIPEEYSAIAEQVYASAYNEPLYDEENGITLYYGAVMPS